MNAAVKRKAPAPVPLKKPQPTKNKKITKVTKPTVKDQFDSDDGNNSASDDEALGTTIVKPVAPKYSDYQKDIKKVKMTVTSSDDDTSDCDKDITVNKTYAKKYDEIQAKKAISGDIQKYIERINKKAADQEKADAKADKRRQRKQKKTQREKMAQEMGMVNDSSDISSDSEESEDDGSYDQQNDLNFLTLLKDLKNKDPKIYDKSRVFYDDVEENEESNFYKKSKSSSSMDKKMTYKELMSTTAKKGHQVDELIDDIVDPTEQQGDGTSTFHYGPLSGAVLTKDEYNQQQEKLRQDFLKAVTAQDKKITTLSKRAGSTMADTINKDSSDDDVGMYLKQVKDAHNKASKKLQNNSDENDSDIDDFFGAGTIINDPNAAPDNTDDDSDGIDDNDLAVADQGKIYSSKTLVRDDLQEAKKVVAQLAKNLNTAGNARSVSISDDKKGSLSKDRAKTAAGVKDEIDEAEKDQFLTKYVIGRWWEEADEDEGVQFENSKNTKATGMKKIDQFTLPAADELFSTHKSILLKSNLAQKDELDEDEVIMRANDMLEYQLNFRFDDEKQAIKETGIASFPRAHTIDGSLRADAQAKKLKRAQQREQQRMELLRQKEMVKRLQAEQKKLLDTKLHAIMKVAGIDMNRLAGGADGTNALWTNADLLEDFDAEKYDKKVAKIYGIGSVVDKKHAKDAIFEKVARDSDFDQSDDNTMSDTTDSDDDGLTARKFLSKEKGEIASRLAQEQEQQFLEIDSHLNKVHQKTAEIRKKLPTLLKDQARQQMLADREKLKSKKRVTNFSSSDSDDSDGNDEDKISKTGNKAAKSVSTVATSSDDEAELPANIKELDRFEAEEEAMARNMKKQAQKAHQTVLRDLDEVFTDPQQEAETWWEEQKRRILGQPEVQERLKAAKTKSERSTLLREIIREEVYKYDDDEENSAVVDLAEEDQRLERLRRAGGQDNYENIPSRKIASNPFLGGFRFQYINVPKADFGLSVDDILNASEKDLNSKVSMKKYFPYRDDNDDNRHFSTIQKDQATRYKKYVASRGNKKVMSMEDFVQQTNENELSENKQTAAGRTITGAKPSKDWKTRHTANWSSRDAERARDFAKKNPKALIQANKSKWLGNAAAKSNLGNKPFKKDVKPFNKESKPINKDAKPFNKK